MSKPPPSRIKVGSVSLPFYEHERGWRWTWKDADGVWKSGTRKNYAEAVEAARAQARLIAGGKLDLSAISTAQADLARQFLAMAPTSADIDRLRRWKSESEITLALAVEKWHSAKLSEIHGRETPHLRYVRQWLEKMAAEFADVPAASITVDQLRAYLEGASSNPKSRRDFRARLVTLWKFAKIQGIFDSLEAEKLPTYRGGVDKHVEVWTPGEMRKMLDACPAEFLPWLVIAGFSGLRSEEICPKPGTKPPLLWSHVGKDYIDVPAATSKVRKRRLVPITPTLAAWLATIPRGKGEVCSSLPSTHVCGILGRLVKGWRKNALRHSYGSYRAAQTKDLPALAVEMGTSVAMIEKHYREAVTDSEAAKWWDVLPVRK